MSNAENNDLEKVVGQIASLTGSLLEEGVDASMIAFALTSVATDMGLQVCGDPARVIPVILGAIAEQTSQRAKDTQSGKDEPHHEIPTGVTLH